jgi:hypothetical protein
VQPVQRRALIAAGGVATCVALGLGVARLVADDARQAPAIAQAPASARERAPAPGPDRVAAARLHAMAPAPPRAEAADPERPAAPVATAPAPEPEAGAEEEEALTGERAFALISAAGRAAETIELAPPRPLEGAVSLTIEGRDPDGPRELVLWRRAAGRLRRVADGASSATGALEFPQLLVSDEPFEIVVTAAETGPDGLDHSAPAHIEAPGPRPPHLRVGMPDAIGLPIRVTAGESAGAVVLADERGVEIGRFAIPELPHPGRRVFDAHLVVPGAPTLLLLAHERPDGARSTWRVETLLPPEDAAR